MFFILSKILLYTLLPMVWITAILLYAIFTRNQKRRKKGILIIFVMLFFFGNGFIVNEAFLCWESDPVPIATLDTYNTAIVLTGITNSEKKPDDRVYFTRGADRLLHTVQLYKAGKVRKILISGGSAAITGEKIREAELLKKAFLYCGVQETDIILENKSRNTRENAQYSKKLIDSLDIKGRYLLITSAFHMRRAQDCFTKAGLKVDIFPVDFYTNKREFKASHLIPTEDTIGKSSLLIHEITGYIIYKLMGYC